MSLFKLIIGLITQMLLCSLFFWSGTTLAIALFNVPVAYPASLVFGLSVIACYIIALIAATFIYFTCEDIWDTLSK